MRRIRVYVAGPLSTGGTYEQVCDNIKKAIEMGEALLNAGYAPYIPHYTHYWNLIHTHSWEEWMDHDKAWVLASDALLRLPGPSKGADQEVEWATEAGIPVFTTVRSLMQSMPLTSESA
jgi:hypothetical protein